MTKTSAIKSSNCFVIMLLFYLCIGYILPAQTTYTTGMFNDGTDFNVGSLIQTADGNHVVACRLRFPQSGFVLYKYDAMGNVVWAQQVNANPSNYMQKVCLAPAPDSGLFFVTQTYVNNSSSLIFLLRLDKNGAQVQPGTSYWYDGSIQQVHAFLRSDSTLLVVGRAVQQSGTEWGIVTFVFSMTGNLIQQSYLEVPTAAGESISLEDWGFWFDNADNLYVTFAISVGFGTYEPVYILFDAQLQVAIAQRFQLPPQQIQPRAIVPDLNGGAYLLGECDSSSFQPTYDNGLGIMHCDQNGQPTFYRQYFPTDTTNYMNRSVHAWTDVSGDLFVLAGNSIYPSPYYPDFIIHLLELSSTGVLLNSGSQGGSQPMAAHSPTSGVSYAFKGAEHAYSQFTVFSNADCSSSNSCSGLGPAFSQGITRTLPVALPLNVIPRMDSALSPTTQTYSLSAFTFTSADYCLIANSAAESPIDGITIYPNPASSQLTIEYTGPAHLVVTDCSGRVIVDREIENQITIDTQAWSNGLYIFRIECNAGRQMLTRKVIINN